MRSLRSSGFTVFEVILTVAIAGFILMGITAMINSLNAVNDRARDLTLANALAENKIESLRSLGFTGLVDGTYDFTSELPTELTGPTHASYSIATSDDPASANPMPNLKRVDITIYYQDLEDTRNLLYTAYIGELGVGQY